MTERSGSAQQWPVSRSRVGSTARLADHGTKSECGGGDRILKYYRADRVLFRRDDWIRAPVIFSGRISGTAEWPEVRDELERLFANRVPGQMMLVPPPILPERAPRQHVFYRPSERRGWVRRTMSGSCRRCLASHRSPARVRAASRTLNRHLLDQGRQQVRAYRQCPQARDSSMRSSWD